MAKKFIADRKVKTIGVLEALHTTQCTTSTTLYVLKFLERLFQGAKIIRC